MNVNGFQLKSLLLREISEENLLNLNDLNRNLYFSFRLLKRKTLERALISVEIFASPVRFRGKIIESKLISIEVPFFWGFEHANI